MRIMKNGLHYLSLIALLVSSMAFIPIASADQLSIVDELNGQARAAVTKADDYLDAAETASDGKNTEEALKVDVLMTVLIQEVKVIRSKVNEIKSQAEKDAKLTKDTEKLAVIDDIIESADAAIDVLNMCVQTLAKAYALIEPIVKPIREKAAAEKLAKEKSSPQPSPQLTLVPSAKPAASTKLSVTCLKGKAAKVVSGVNPKCPSGYKKKA